MYNQPYYDNDTVTLGYLKDVLGDNWTEIANVISKTSKNYGTTPTTPYHKYDTFMTDDGIYICINDREIGEFDINDWTLAGTYKNTKEDFEQGNGIITKGTLQATQGGTNTAGLTGKNSGENAIRIWAGSTLSGIDTAPFRVTQGGALVATNATITGNITATSGSISGSLVSSGINASNITAGTLNADRISGGSISASSITGSSSINITRSGGYYFNMGVSTSHPNVSGLNVGAAGLSVNGQGLTCNGATWQMGGDLQLANITSLSNLTMSGTLTCTGTVKTNDIRPGGSLAITTGGAGGTPSGYGILLRAGAGHITLDAGYGGTGFGVYATGLNVTSNSSVTTNAGQASSKNVKTNIIEFSDKKYNTALEILRNMKIYSYDYIYSLYRKKHQYGFIIDEVEKIKDADKYFDFYESKAKIEGKKLDFAIEEKDTKDIITVKQYNPDTLDKFMLTTIKALQLKIDDLEKEIKMLKEEK